MRFQRIPQNEFDCYAELERLTERPRGPHIEPGIVGQAVKRRSADLAPQGQYHRYRLLHLWRTLPTWWRPEIKMGYPNVLPPPPSDFSLAITQYVARQQHNYVHDPVRAHADSAAVAVVAGTGLGAVRGVLSAFLSPPAGRIQVMILTETETMIQILLPRLPALTSLPPPYH